MTYMTVLALEFAPMVFERLRAPRILRILRAISIPLIILGITLSIMHQSSLGSMFLIFPEKLSPLWYTPIFPVLFFISAVAVGLAMVTVESLLSAKFMRRDAHMDLLNTVARATAAVLLIYAVIKMADVTIRGTWTALAPFDWTDAAWLLELGPTVLLPTALLLRPAVRASRGSCWRHRRW